MRPDINQIERNGFSQYVTNPLAASSPHPALLRVSKQRICDVTVGRVRITSAPLSISWSPSEIEYPEIIEPAAADIFSLIDPLHSTALCHSCMDADP
jgi:hypothetical protein